MNNAMQKRIQEIERANGKGKSGADIAISEMKNKDNREVIESSKQEDPTTNQLRQEAQQTREAYDILNELKQNPNVSNSIAEISKELEKVCIKHFNCSSIHQKAVDKCVEITLSEMRRKEIAKVAAQLATNIMTETIENVAQHQENTKDEEEREI